MSALSFSGAMLCYSIVLGATKLIVLSLFAQKVFVETLFQVPSDDIVPTIRIHSRECAQVPLY